MDDQLSRPGTDRRAKGVVTLIDGGTPLPESSIVYFANENSAAEDQWTRITSQENLAAVNANPEQFKFLTLFTVPVDELARAPIAHVARAQAELDKIERRRAKAERRTGDRLPDGPLRWDDSPDLLDMKAGANELQSAVERATNSALHFIQIRTADAAAAVSYAKYLSLLAGAAQASRCRAQGGDTTDEAAGAASQSQAVPSELVSLSNEEIDAIWQSMPGGPSQWLKGFGYQNFAKAVEAEVLLNVQRSLSHSAATGKVPEGWKLVPVEPTEEMVIAFAEEWFSKVRCIDDHDMTDAYSDMLAASPAAPLAGKAEPEGLVLAPHFRGYAHLGIGAYIINHSSKGEDAELVISVATDEQKAGRTVGDLRGNAPDAVVQPETMAARLRFENVAGLDALEQQLRLLRAEHFTAPLAAAVPAEEASDEPKIADIPLWHHNEYSKEMHPDPCGEWARADTARHAALTSVLADRATRKATPAEPAPILDPNQVQTIADRIRNTSGLPEPATIQASAARADTLNELHRLFRTRAWTDREGSWDDALVAVCEEIAGRCQVARLSKPTAQGSAQSIDTDELRELIGDIYTAGANNDSIEKSENALIRHIAAQAPAGRDAVQWIGVDERLPEVGRLVIVYRPATQYDHPGDINVAFDCIDPNDDDHASWLGHNEHYEHFCCVAKPEGSIGPSEKAPYTHWMPLPAAPHAAEHTEGEQ